MIDFAEKETERAGSLRPRYDVSSVIHAGVLVISDVLVRGDKDLAVAKRTNRRHWDVCNL